MPLSKALCLAFGFTLRAPFSPPLNAAQFHSMASTRLEALSYADQVLSFPSRALLETYGVENEVGETTEKATLYRHHASVRDGAIFLLPRPGPEVMGN